MNRILLLFLLLFITSSGDVNSKNVEKSTKLIEAVKRGDFKEVKVLIKNGADVNTKDENGEAILIVGYKEPYRHLLKNKGNFNTIKTTKIIRTANKANEDIVKLFIKKGADPNTKDKNGDPILTLAFRRGHSELVKTLLEKGAEPNTKSKDGDPILIAAFKQGNAELVKTLLEKGAEPNTKSKDGDPILIAAFKQGNAELVKTLLEKGADVNAKDGDGDSVLTRAYNYRTELEKELNNTTNKKYITFLLDSLTETIELFIEKGAKAN